MSSVQVKAQNGVVDVKKFRWELLVSVIGWYLSNVGVLLSNSYILSKYGFRRPIFLTFCHMLSCCIFSLLIVSTRLVKLQYIKSRSQFFKVLLLSALFSFSVALGNASLKFIPISFSQTIGATTPIFTALLAYLIQGKLENGDTYQTLVPIVIGTLLASGGEPSFNIIGFVAAFLATFSRAFKSVIQAVLLSEPEEKLNGLNLLLYMAPLSTAILIPWVIILEPQAIQEFQNFYRTDKYFIIMILLNAFVAYFVNLCNFIVTKYTSALSLQVLGIVKGIVAVVVSLLVFRNAITVQGSLGYGLSLIGIFFYQKCKARDQQKAKANRAESSSIKEVSTQNNKV